MRHNCCSETSRLGSRGYPLHSGGTTRPAARCTIGKLSRAEFESLGKTHATVKRNHGDHKRQVSYATSSITRKRLTDESGDRPLGAQLRPFAAGEASRTIIAQANPPECRCRPPFG